MLRLFGKLVEQGGIMNKNELLQKIYKIKLLIMEDEANVVNWLHHSKKFDKNYWISVWHIAERHDIFKSLEIYKNLINVLESIEEFFVRIYKINISDFKKIDLNKETINIFLSLRSLMEKAVKHGISIVEGVSGQERTEDFKNFISSFNKNGINKQERSDKWLIKRNYNNLKDILNKLEEMNFFDLNFKKHFLKVFSILSIFIHEGTTKNIEPSNIPWLIGYARLILLSTFFSIIFFFPLDISKDKEEKLRKNIQTYKNPVIGSKSNPKNRILGKYIFSPTMKIDLDNIKLKINVDEKNVDNKFFEFVIDDKMMNLFDNDGLKEIKAYNSDKFQNIKDLLLK